MLDCSHSGILIILSVNWRHITDLVSSKGKTKAVYCCDIVVLIVLFWCFWCVKDYKVESVLKHCLMRLWIDINQLTFVFPFAKTRSVDVNWPGKRIKSNSAVVHTVARRRHSLLILSVWSIVRFLVSLYLVSCDTGSWADVLSHDTPWVKLGDARAGIVTLLYYLNEWVCIHLTCDQKLVSQFSLPHKPNKNGIMERSKRKPLSSPEFVKVVWWVGWGL